MREYDLNKMQQLLHDFYDLTGIKICIYDSRENELCYYPEKLTPFCRCLREDKAQDKACRLSDKNAFLTCRRTRRQTVLECHAGLLECFSPIFCEGKLIGYIAIGQIRSKPHAPKSVPEELRPLYEALPSIPMRKIDAAMHILDACAGYEYLKALVETYESRIDTRFSEYIEEHLEGDLSVTALCRAFYLSRAELYGIFRTYFHASVADFVRGRRLERAKVLLKTTPLLVKEIAVQCGIPDYNYFSKQFRRAFGVTPTALRKGVQA